MAQQDFFYNVLANPEFTNTHFKEVGINVRNSTMQDKDFYLKNKAVVSDFTDDKGNFNKAAYEAAYYKALDMYNSLADDTYREDALESATYAYNDIFAPPSNRRSRLSSAPMINNLGDPIRNDGTNYRQYTQGVEGAFVTGKTDKNIDEIAQSQKVWDGSKWVESPEENFWANLWDTRVKATWDFDADENGNPTNDKSKIVHYKGELKLNEDGLPYYENLNGRSLAGKEVLHLTDILTNEDSALNTIDFFDSDDLHKSATGVLMKNLVTIAPMLIPGINTYYIGAGVALEAAKLATTGAKLILGSDVGVLNNMEGFLTKFESSPLKSDSKSSWTLNNFINLAGDVYKQLAEQRWLFKYGTLLLSKGVSSEEKLAKLQEATLKQLNESSKNSLNKLLDKGDIDTLTYIKRIKEYEVANSFAASKSAQNTLKHWQDIGEEMSRIYMTGITVADSYNQAKEQGLSDFEAALYTLGYGLGEYALLRTDVGKWVLPETKFDAYRMNTALSKWGAAIDNKAAKDLASTASKEAAKKASALSWIKKGWEASKLENRISPSVTFNMGKYAVGNALSEGFEETTEELLADLSKSLFNAYATLSGSQSRLDAWDNILDRYSMSFFGGMLGGGLFSLNGELKTAYQAASEMTDTDAGREIMQMLRDGKRNELERRIKKATWANPYLSSNLQEVKDKGVLYGAGTKENNLNTTIQNVMIKQLDILESVMKQNGLDVPQDSIIGSYLPDLKFAALMNSSQLAKYNQDFKRALDNAMKKAVDYNSYVTAEGKQSADNADGDLKSNERTIENKAKAKSKLNEALALVEKFKSGEMSRDYILAGVFELNPRLKGTFIKPNYRDWLQQRLNKDFKDITKQEYEQYKQTYTDYLQGEYKDDIMMANQILLKYLTKVNPKLASILPTRVIDELSKKLDTSINIMEESQKQGGKSANINLQLILSLLEIAAPTKHKELLDKLKDSATYEALIPDLNNLETYQQQLYEAEQALEADPENETLQSNVQAISANLENLKNQLSKANDTAGNIKNYLEELDRHNRSIKAYSKLLNAYQKNLALGSIESLGTDVIPIIESMHRIDTLEGLKSFTENIKALLESSKELKALTEEYRKVLKAKDKLSQAHQKLQEEIANNVLDMDRVTAYLSNLIETDQGVFDSIVKTLKGGINPITKGYYKNLFDTFEVPVGDANIYTIFRLLNDSSNIEQDILRILDEVSFALKPDKKKPKEKKSEETSEEKTEEKTEETPKTISQIVQKLNQEFFNQSNNIEQVNITGDVDEAINTIELAQATLSAYSRNPTLTNIQGYSSVFNELFPDSKEKLLEIDETTISEYINALEQIKAHLQYIKELSERNSNNKIKEQKDTGIQLSYLIYSEVERLRRIIGEDDDWVSRDLLDKALEAGKALGEKDQNLKTQEEAKNNFELNLHNFLQANLGILDNNEKMAKIFNLANFKFGTISKETITKDSKSLDARSFFFYLASVAAINPNNFYFNYKDKLSKEVGPFALQEMQLFMATAKLLNEEVVNKFIKHYNYIIENITPEQFADEQLVSERDLTLDFIKDSKLYLKYDIATFIEGVAGAGKTTAILNMLFKLLGKDNPLFKKVLVASSSIANSQQIIDNSIIDNANCTAYTKTSRKGHNDPILLDRISPTHKDLVKNEGDNQTPADSAVIEYINGFPVLVEDKVNKESDPPTLLIIDEAQLYSAFDLDIICKYCKENGTKLILLGDLQQTGISGKSSIKYNKNEYTLESEPSRNQFFGGFKLGVPMRSQNKALADSVEVFRMGTEDIKRPIQASYYETDNQIKGVKVIPFDSDGKPVDENEDRISVEDILPQLKKMVNRDGTYTIITDRNTKGEEPDDLVTEIVKSLGEAKVEILEGVSYSGVTRDNVIAIMDSQDRRRIYTAVSRAKEGVLLFTPSLVTHITSRPVNGAPNTGYNAQDIEKVFIERKKILDEVYTSGGPLSVAKSSEEPSAAPTSSPDPNPSPNPSPKPSPDPSGDSSEGDSSGEGTGNTPPPLILPPSVKEPSTEVSKETALQPHMNLPKGKTRGYTFNADYIDTEDVSNSRIDGVIGVAKILVGRSDEEIKEIYQEIRKTIIYGGTDGTKTERGTNVSEIEKLISGYLDNKPVLIKSIGIKVYNSTNQNSRFYLSRNKIVTDVTTGENSIERYVVALIQVEDKMLEIPICRPASIITFMETHPDIARAVNYNRANPKQLIEVREALKNLQQLYTNPGIFDPRDIKDAIILGTIFVSANEYYYEIYSNEGKGDYSIQKFFDLQQERKPYIVQGNIGTNLNKHKHIKHENFDFFNNEQFKTTQPVYFKEDVTLCGMTIPSGTPVILFSDYVESNVLDEDMFKAAQSTDPEDYIGMNVLILNQPKISAKDYIEYVKSRSKQNKFNPAIGNQLTNVRVGIAILEAALKKADTGDARFSDNIPSVKNLLDNVKAFFDKYYEFDGNVYRRKNDAYNYREITQDLQIQSWYKSFNSIFNPRTRVNLLKIVDTEVLERKLDPYFPNGIYISIKGSNEDSSSNYVKLALDKNDDKYYYRVNAPGFKEFIMPIDSSIKTVSTTLILDLNDIDNSLKLSMGSNNSVRVFSKHPRTYPTLEPSKYHSLLNGTDIKDKVTATDQKEFIKQCAEYGYIIIQGGRDLVRINEDPIEGFSFEMAKNIPKISNAQGRKYTRVFKAKQGDKSVMIFVSYDNGNYSYEVKTSDDFGGIKEWIDVLFNEYPECDITSALGYIAETNKNKISKDTLLGKSTTNDASFFTIMERLITASEANSSLEENSDKDACALGSGDLGTPEAQQTPQTPKDIANAYNNINDGLDDISF